MQPRGWESSFVDTSSVECVQDTPEFELATQIGGQGLRLQHSDYCPVGTRAWSSESQLRTTWSRITD